MRKAIVIGGNPYIKDVYLKDSKSLFDETGGNSGNLAFQYAIVSHLKANVPIVEWNASPEQLRSMGDILVLPLANQLGKHTDLGSLARKLKEFQLPVIGIGLGAQSTILSPDIELTDGTKNWLQVLAASSPSDAPNLGVRGAFTKSQIEKLGYPNSSIVSGCPSNFINYRLDLPDVLERKYKFAPKVIAVAAGIPYGPPELSKIEQDLADIVTVTGGAYIVQHGLEMLRLARDEFDKIDPKTLDLCKNFVAPNKSMEEFKTWCRKYAYAIYDARAWLDFLRRFDFVVGTRFHGAMLAIQAGVPAAVIAHDSRTREMCETMGIPVRNYSEIKGITANNIRDYFSFDAEEFRNKRRELLGNYLQLFKSAEIEISPQLSQLSNMILKSV